MKRARDTQTSVFAEAPDARGHENAIFVGFERLVSFIRSQGPRIFPPGDLPFATYSRAGCGAVGFEAYTACIRRWTPLDKGGYAGVMSNILLPLSPLLRTLLLHIAWHNLVWRGHLMGGGVAPFASWPPFFGRIKASGCEEKGGGLECGRYVCTASGISWLRSAARSSYLITFYP